LQGGVEEAHDKSVSIFGVLHVTEASKYHTNMPVVAASDNLHMITVLGSILEGTENLNCMWPRTASFAKRLLLHLLFVFPVYLKSATFISASPADVITDNQILAQRTLKHLNVV
jgi:hypothetical protein